MENMSEFSQNSIWVFGYGSLTWKPDFAYQSKEIGYIKGYQRRFWQGNVTHRGTVNKPGRVATLVKSEKDYTLWGVAYEIIGKDNITKALGYLNHRETTLGGYTTLVEDFFSRSEENTKRVLIFTATHENDLYLGPSNMATIAMEIVMAEGDKGSNTEYVTRLAQFVRENIPEENDIHLFTLERFILFLSHRITKIRNSFVERAIPLSYNRLVTDTVRTRI